MAYCTQTDLLKAVSEAELAKQTNDTAPTLVDTARVAAAIAQADSVIDAWCGSRYTMPISPVPALITGISVDIALWVIFTRRDTKEISAARQARYEAALDMLKAIASGKILLDVAMPDTTATTGIMQATAPERLFTADLMDRY